MLVLVLNSGTAVMCEYDATVGIWGDLGETHQVANAKL